MKRLYIRSVKGKGRGVFCNRRIAKGETVELAPVIVVAAEDNTIVKATCLNSYVFTLDKETGTVAVVLGFGSVYNHATHSNAAYEWDPEAGLIHFYAVKDIPAGTEICTNYGGDCGRVYDEWFRTRNLPFAE